MSAGPLTLASTVDFSPGDKLRAGGVRKAVRIGVNRAASTVKAAVVRNAEGIKRFGFLAKAQRIRSRLYPGDKFVAVVGPKKDFVRQKGKYTRGRRAGEPRKHRPAAVAHLVEKGTRRSRPKSFLRPALDATGPTYLREAPLLIFREMALQLARSAAKGR